jgi:hypothetical protein
MLITELTVVNACLASMGEEPINSLSETNAFVNSALFALENANLNEQSEGWWYNKERIQIFPDINGLYIVPSDVIDLDVDHKPAWLTIRNQRLYDTNGGHQLTGTSPLWVHITRLLEFENVPLIGRRTIKASAVLSFQQSYDGDAVKIKEAETEYAMAHALAKVQHIRAIKANFGQANRRHAMQVGSVGRLRTPR